MKEYETPELIEVQVEIEDIIAASNLSFGEFDGDSTNEKIW